MLIIFKNINVTWFRSLSYFVLITPAVEKGKEFKICVLLL